MKFDVSLIDAFVGDGFQGNLAGVLLVKHKLSSRQMQEIAFRVGASETAFIFENQIRWFTPRQEVDLCGHATLAAAHWLWETARVSEDVITFGSHSGELICRREKGFIETDFPDQPLVESEPERGLLEALGLRRPISVMRSGAYFLVEVSDESLVTGLQPDFAALARLACDGVFVTAAGTNCDFVSRCFFPKEGIPEDPVTGSAHCAVGPYWRKRLGRSHLRAHQRSREGGEIRISFRAARVVLGGLAKLRTLPKVVEVDSDQVSKS